MKELNGRELAGCIKERQVHTVKALRSRKIFPKLAIFYDNDSPVIAKYMSLKQAYGEDIGIEVVVTKIATNDAEEKIRAAAEDETDAGKTALEKDVDGLRGETDTATAMAIHWLLTGYGIDLRGKKLGIIGHGKLVGAPLEKMWRESGYDVTVYDKGDDTSTLPDCDVVVTATGVPGLVKSTMLKYGAVVVDAGTASEGGVIKGDVDDAVREREDLTITPKIGGVGPLTVTMLFERVLQAAQK